MTSQLIKTLKAAAFMTDKNHETWSHVFIFRSYAQGIRVMAADGSNACLLPLNDTYGLSWPDNRLSIHAASVAFMAKYNREIFSVSDIPSQMYGIASEDVGWQFVQMLDEMCVLSDEDAAQSWARVQYIPLAPLSSVYKVLSVLYPPRRLKYADIILHRCELDYYTGWKLCYDGNVFIIRDAR